MKILLAPLVAALLLPCAYSQTATTTTTLASAAGRDDTTIYLTTPGTLVNGNILYMDREVMSIKGTIGAGYIVERGKQSTSATAHATGVPVLAGDRSIILLADPAGACPATSSTATYVNPANGRVWTCPSGSWIYMDHLLLVGAATGGLVAANNLSDVASASAARTNLGLGSSATQTAEFYRADQLTTANNGIAIGLSNCAGLACVVEATPLYPAVEVRPFGGANNVATSSHGAGPASANPIAGVLDYSYGVPQWIFNGSQPIDSRHNAEPGFAMNSITVGAGQYAHYPSALRIENQALAGGRNGDQVNGDKTNVGLLEGYLYKYTLAQGGGAFSLWSAGFANGDNVGFVCDVITYGNLNTQGDEGGECEREETIEGGSTFSETIASLTVDGTTAASTITGSGITANTTQGEDRLGIDLTQAYNAGYISSIANAGGLTVYTGTNTNWDAAFGTSTVTTTTQTIADPIGGTATFTGSGTITGCSVSGGTGYTPGLLATLLPVGTWTTAPSFHVNTASGGALSGCTVDAGGTGVALTALNVVPPNSFPQISPTLTVSNSTGLGSKVCVFDYDYECMVVTNNNTVTNTLTLAQMNKPHRTGATLASGGMTGMAIELEADRVDPANLRGIAAAPDSTLSQVVRVAVPIMYNATGQQITVYQPSGVPAGQFGGYAGRAYPSMGSGGTVTLTIPSGSVTGCSASGGTGYLTTRLPQVQITATATTQPAVHITTASAGGITGCAVDAAGSGITGTPTVTVVPTNAYDVYPATKITSVYNATTGQVDGTLKTQPWMGTPSVGDRIEVPHYFYAHNSGTNSVVAQYVPTYPNTSHSAFRYSMDGIWQGNDTASNFANNTNPAVYNSYPLATPWLPGYGQMQAPYGHFLAGPFRNGLYLQTPPFGSAVTGAVVVGCGNPSNCATWTQAYNFLSGSNALGGEDIIKYTAATGIWAWTSGATSSQGGAPYCIQKLYGTSGNGWSVACTSGAYATIAANGTSSVSANLNSTPFRLEAHGQSSLGVDTAYEWSWQHKISLSAGVSNFDSLEVTAPSNYGSSGATGTPTLLWDPIALATTGVDYSGILHDLRVSTDDGAGGQTAGDWDFQNVVPGTGVAPTMNMLWSPHGLGGIFTVQSPFYANELIGNAGGVTVTYGGSGCSGSTGSGANAVAGTLTAGTAGASCTYTFTWSTAFPHEGVVMMNDQTSTGAAFRISAASTTATTVTGTGITAADVLAYAVIGY